MFEPCMHTTQNISMYFQVVAGHNVFNFYDHTRGSQTVIMYVVIIKFRCFLWVPKSIATI